MLKNALKSPQHMGFGLLASTVLLAMVAYASNQTVGMFGVAIGTVLVLMGAFHFLFGHNSSFFNIIFANAITLYLCFFTFFVDSVFSPVERSMLPIGFGIPPLAFLAGAILHRHKIKKIVSSGKVGPDTDFAQAFFWLLPIVAVGCVVFVSHQWFTLDPHTLTQVFLIEMTLIGVIAFLASEDFALLLMDTGMLFSDFFASNVRLIKPVFAFFTFYSLIIIIFSALYRIIDVISTQPNFLLHGAPHHLTFVESLYFSLVTISTLGYGDIIPLTNGIRFLVGLQTLLGTMLFFFGVHAILAHHREASKT